MAEPLSIAPKGRTTIAEDVAMQIAGHAARQIDGVHSLGKGSILSRITGADDDLKTGIHAAVGELEVAFDLEIVVDYGHPIQEVVSALRNKIAGDVKLMLDRDLVELNIKVVGIEFPEVGEDPKPRVR